MPISRLAAAVLYVAWMHLGAGHSDAQIGRPQWDPVKVIDASDLVVTLARLDPANERPLAHKDKPGGAIGLLMELQVLDVLAGELKKGEKIWVYRPAWGGHDQLYFDAEFILFLRKMTKAEVDYLKETDRFNGGNEVWTFSFPSQVWMSYYPLKAGSGLPIQSWLKVELQTVGVNANGRDPIEYLKGLIELRKQSKVSPVSPDPKADRFQKAVVAPAPSQH